MAKWKGYTVTARRGKDSARYYVNATSKDAAIEMVMQQLREIKSVWRGAAFNAEVRA